MANYRRKTQARSSRRRGSSSLVWVWIFMGIFIGIAITASSYIFLTKPNFTQFVQRKSTAPTSPKYTIERSAKKEKEKQAAERFEFYTLLPGMEIQLPDKHTSPHQPPISQPSKMTEPVTVLVRPQTSPPLVPQTPSGPSKTAETKAIPRPLVPPSAAPTPTRKGYSARYIIQAGVFQNLQQADELKAKLTLQGFSPRIQKVQAKTGQAWFRVTLGPYASESNALSQKNRLEEQQIRSILILQRPNE
jgi:cell division protein FtsN